MGSGLRTAGIFPAAGDVPLAVRARVRAGLELSGFSTLDRLAAKIRTRVNGEIRGHRFRMGEAARARMRSLKEVADGKQRSAEGAGTAGDAVAFI